MYATDRLVEIYQRSRAGHYMKEVEFDLMLARRTRELVQEYSIDYNPENVCPADDDLADRVFQAGLQLLADIGAYHLDSQRVIRFSREEILEALRQAPDTLYLGEGKDMVVARHRGVEDPNPPLNLTGPAGQPCSEDYYLPLMISYAQEPYVHAIESGATLTYNGSDIMAGTLMEVKAVQRDSATAREAIRRVGKPGMHIGDCATGMTAIGKMAASEPVNLLRPCDGRLVAQMCELKTNDDQLVRVPHLVNYGSHIINLMTPLTGGIGGGPAGVAVVSVAETLFGVMCYFATYHYLSITHIKWQNNSDPWGMYVLAMAGQAMARNSHIVWTNDPFCVNGAGTVENLYEVAGHAIIGSVCGYHQHGVGSTGGNMVDHHSGLEAGFQGEVGLAATRSGLRREQANAIAQKLLPLYKHTFIQPNLGRPFNELYDVKSITPKQDWQDCYRQAKATLGELGLQFTHGPYD
ncbi:MAG TPA: monomethylamine:corrinoid methyltransferase [Anaerolineales bacterium]|nr:monomethylamine:corrinoid methyltransferase [Anaerolineales bacterium]